MMTGFLKRADGTWVYADSRGRPGGRLGARLHLRRAQLVLPGSRDEVMATGWLAQGGTWYYLGADGAMRTGWAQVNGSWYYFNASGAMVTGWVNLGGVWYYLGPDGAMLTGTQVINGRTYTFDESGAWHR